MDTPPFEVTPSTISLLADLERLLGRFEGRMEPALSPVLRRSQRVKTVHGSVSIEGNTLTEDQITALLDGKRVAGPAADIREVLNANTAYEKLAQWNPHSSRDLLQAHGAMMAGLVADAGRWRKGGAGIVQGKKVVHLAPPASRVPPLMKNLCAWLRREKKLHPAIKAAVFHYELEFIHPFSDGNGRMGRLWHTLILSKYQPLFLHVPVESVIRARQRDYYQALAAADQTGKATPFIEFSLSAVVAALRQTLEDLRPEPVTASHRLDLAMQHFAGSDFSRKDYLKLFPALSTATASRDLDKAVKAGRLRRKGDKAQAVYHAKKAGAPRKSTQ